MDISGLFPAFINFFTDAPPILIALLYGLLPALIWLFFWIAEDRKRPEPKRLIALAFIAGMIAVPLSITIEMWIEASIGGGFLKTLLWSLTEEVMKYTIAFILVLRAREFDEALDAFIYMICVALGFAALENTLYALDPILASQQLNAATLTNLRFIGATLVHTISSATVGIFLAFSFYKPIGARARALIYGLILATGLHTLFNFFIMSVSLKAVYVVFAVIWIMALGLILIAERIKKLDDHYTARL